MHPRYRRLLIPGLLVGLVVVVVIASLAQKADAAESTTVSVIDDPRITEASGLAISLDHRDLVYVINDSGHAAEVFAVRLSTGEVVGTTSVAGATWQDAEALAIDADGTLWVADTGDNLRRRSGVALYALAEPGPGDHVVQARRFPVTFADGAHDVEALLIDPTTATTYLVTKGLLRGQFFALPDELTESGPNVASVVGGNAPGMVTGGAFAHDGRRLFLRTYSSVHEYDPVDFTAIGLISAPRQEQGESLAVESGDATLLLGTEGRPAPIIRLNVSTPAPTPAASSVGSSVAPSGRDHEKWWLAGGVAVGAALGVVLVSQGRVRPE